MPVPETRPLRAKDLESTVLESPTLPLLAGQTPAVGSAIVEPQELVAANYQAVYGYAYRLSGCQASAEDITQETFLQALKHLHQLRCSQAQRGWLLSIARRAFLRQATKGQAGCVQSLQAINGEVEKALGSTSRGQSETGQVDDQDLVQAALGQLGHDARLIVVMFYMEELSYNQIAQQLQIPIGTVMSRLNRSREALRRVLDVRSSPAATTSVKSNIQAQEAKRDG